MARLSFFILFFLCSLAGQTRVINGHASSPIAGFQRFNEKLPDNELKTAVAEAAVYPVTPAFKLLTGILPGNGSVLQQYAANDAALLPSFSTGHSKCYLLHIYPFLHFW